MKKSIKQTKRHNLEVNTDSLEQAGDLYIMDMAQDAMTMDFDNLNIYQ